MNQTYILIYNGAWRYYYHPQNPSFEEWKDVVQKYVPDTFPARRLHQTGYIRTSGEPIDALPEVFYFNQDTSECGTYFIRKCRAEMLFCHMCGAETEHICQDCNEPVCEDCVMQMTYHNQIDYTKCRNCQDGYEAESRLIRLREDEAQQAERARKEAVNAKARATYRKPENVTKRKEAAAKREKARAALKLKQFQEAMQLVGELFRGS